jgi:biotin carboxyl carrier protein
MKKDHTTQYLVNGESRFRFAASNFKLKKERGTRVQRNNDGAFTVSIGEQQFTGKVIARKQNRYEVEVNGNNYRFCVEQENTVKRTQPLFNTPGQNSADSLRAPMPGKINEIFVSEGCEVAKGEPVLTLEAMKMQNQVLAPCDSKILQLKVKAGETVLGDQDLLTLQPINRKP